MNTFAFGATPVEIIKSKAPIGLELSYRGLAAEVCNKLMFNKESNDFNEKLNQNKLIYLLNSLKSVVLGKTNYWTYEEIAKAEVLRCEILLTLGLKEE